MKKLLLCIAAVLLSVSCMYGCSIFHSNDSTTTSPPKSSTFSIQFLDVGQGDSALIECDGRYMLIDAGDKAAGDKVYSVLEENRIQHLDILAMSHLHEDHIGGLIKALTYASNIDLTLSNSDYRDNNTFREVEQALGINKARITVPHIGDKFRLGSADVEVVDVSKETENDSLVLLLTYGKTRFLFTGDIEYEAQKRIVDKYANEKDEPYRISLIKMPHHGSYEGSLYTFLRTFMPDYAVISVGKGNPYGHPHHETTDLLDQAKIKYFRTDVNGDIIVKSDGDELFIETKK